MEGSLGCKAQIQFVGKWRRGDLGSLPRFSITPTAQRPCPKYPVFGIAGVGWLV